MNRFLAVVASAALLSSSAGRAAQNQYKIIPQRNAFGLTTPPILKSAEPIPSPEPLPNIKFTGISVLGGEKRAWFIVTGPRPGDKPDYWDLVVGQRKGGLELLQILPTQGEVKVNNSGKEMLLSFKVNGNVPVITATAPVQPATPSQLLNSAFQPVLPIASTQPQNSAGFPNNQQRGNEMRALEKQILHHEIQRETQKNNPDFPPLPPAMQ